MRPKRGGVVELGQGDPRHGDDGECRQGQRPEHEVEAIGPGRDGVLEGVKREPLPYPRGERPRGA